MAILPNTLLQQVSSYPVFEANQLLSFRDLNQVRDYLDQQTRFSRVCLTGSGIVCGLRARRSADTVTISAGCGVTSEGFLIALDECTARHYMDISLPRSVFLGRETTPNDLVPAHELLEAETEDTTPLSAGFVNGKAVVLLLECAEEKNESCLDDCNETGRLREFTVRKLLIDAETAHAIVEENLNPTGENGQRKYPNLSLDELLNAPFPLPDLYLERFGYTPESGQVKLTKVDSYKTFVELYAAIIRAGQTRIANALNTAHKAVSPLLSSNRLSALPDLNKQIDLDQIVKERPHELQYVYDHLADLILAYDEFRSEAFDLMDVCRAEAGWFPKHLFLGLALVGSQEPSIPPSTLRTTWVQPPAYNGNRARVGAVQVLFQRLAGLMSLFSVPAPAPQLDIRITPSRWGQATLSARAIPYYYAAEKLYGVWNADRHRKARDHRVHSYYRPQAPENQANPPYDDPLVFDFEGHDFYRIEGHIGLEKLEVCERIKELRQCFNLAFDLVVLKLGEINDDAFEHDCEFQILQSQYIKLRTDLACALERTRQFQDTIREDRATVGPVQDLLDELKPALDDFDYDSFKADFDEVREIFGEPGTCLLGYDHEAFKQLSELHRTRKSEVLDRTLFHEFAESNPGMEHKAGVPRGGTFVLVYDERALNSDEQKRFLKGVPASQREQLQKLIEADAKVLTQQIVVADFCLPYACCVECPPIAYVIPRPRPTFLIDPMAFCANDGAEYDFVVNPPGGVIMGPGTHRDGARYYFVPNDSGIDSGNVEVTYSVDGADATLILQIKAVPQATFEQIPAVTCHNRQVSLNPLPGTPSTGKFTTDIDPGDDQLGIIESDGEVSFDPTVDGVPTGVTIQISYAVTAENGCSASTFQEIRVQPEPNAGFSGLRSDYCTSDDATPLIPNDASVGSTFEGDGVAQGVFNPAAVEFEGFQARVDVTHTVVDQHKCRSSLKRSTTVHRAIDAGNFRLGRPTRDEFRIFVPVLEIQPGQLSGGPLVYLFSWFDRENKRVEEPPRKDSKDFQLTIAAERLAGMAEIEVRMVIENGPCRSGEAGAVAKLSFNDDVGDQDVKIIIENGRLSASREQLGALAESNPDLAQTKTFKLADGLLDEDRSQATADVVQDFSAFVTTALRGFRQVESEDRKKDFRTIAGIAANTVVDRVGVAPPKAEVIELAAEQLQKLDEVGLDLAALRKEWLKSDLAEALDETGLNAAKALLG